MRPLHASVRISLLLALSSGVAAAELPEILFTRQLLEARSLSVGDTVTLASEPDGSGARRYRIVGSYEPTPNPFRLTAKRYEARFHLGDLLDALQDPADPLSAESVSHINVRLAEAADARATAREIDRRVPGLYSYPSDAVSEANMFEVLERFHIAIAVVTVLGSTAFLLALMVMRADQRRETAGILRLIGFSRPRILVEVFVEGVIIAVAGAVFGVLLAGALQAAFNAFFQWYYDTALIFVRVTPALALRCVVLAVPLGVLAGVVASWTLLRRNILSLLRR